MITAGETQKDKGQHFFSFWIKRSVRVCVCVCVYVCVTVPPQHGGKHHCPTAGAEEADACL